MKFLMIAPLVLLFTINSGFTQTVEEKLTDFDQDKVETIEAIKKNLAQTKALLHTKEVEANLEKDKSQKIILEGDLKRLRDRYAKIKLNLVSVITDIKIDEIKKPEEVHKRDLLQEAQELLGPALDTVQRISAKPRKIEALKKEIASYQEKIALTDIALKNIETVTKSPDFKALVPDLESYIEESKYNVGDLRQELNIKLDHVNRDLADLTKDDKSVFDATTVLLHDFFSTKGKNLAVATFIFFLTIWGVSKLRLNMLIPLVEKNQDKVFYKTLNALYGFISISSATALSLFTLYLLGDWVLVTFLILIIAGTLWAFKDYIRKLTAEGRLILNLGCVKEGDLIVYRDLNWRVKNISFVTILENPFLDSPLLRLEISEIFRMPARKALANEPWFPSQSGDWVLLNDGTFGQVKIQTVEHVVVEELSSQRKFYSVAQFLSHTPTNLSYGFTLDFSWGLDYLDQAKMISTIIPMLNQKMRNLLKNYPCNPQEFTLDFQSAGSSALNVNIVARFAGEHAKDRAKILKDLQGMLLTICTEEKLNLPFNQIVVHSAPQT